MTNEQAITQLKDIVKQINDTTKAITEKLEAFKSTNEAFKEHNEHWEEQAARRLQNLKEKGLNTEELEEVFNDIKQAARTIEGCYTNMQQAVNQLNSITV